MSTEKSKAYLVAVDMGYGHQRALFPLESVATLPVGWGDLDSSVISANGYPGIPESDKRSWEGSRKIYEWVSRMKSVPFLGRLLFGIMDYFQRIESFYPKRDLSKASIQVREIYKMIEGGFGKHLVEKLNENPLPLLSSFFIPAFFAEEHGYKGEIYCLCTDTDISRAWAPLYPEKSRIVYLAPTNRVKERLELYGIRSEKIILTGFPLPKELLGEEKSLEIAKEVLHRRVLKLDPQKKYEEKFKALIADYIPGNLNVSGPVSLTFAVGGAGAQLDIAVNLIKSLSSSIEENKIKFNLVAGTSSNVYDEFKRVIKEVGLEKAYDGGKINILYNPKKFDYFREFSTLLINTDILWTKPSELSFYAGLGLPILMAEPVGSQEDFNRSWLRVIEAGIDQEDPRYVSEWIFDWISSGCFAEAAMNGFINAPKRGAYHIQDLLMNGEIKEIEKIHAI